MKKIIFFLLLALLSFLFFFKNKSDPSFFKEEDISSFRTYYSSDENKFSLYFDIPSYNGTVFVKIVPPEKEFLGNTHITKELDFLIKNNLPIEDDLKKYVTYIYISKNKADGFYFKLNKSHQYNIDFYLGNTNLYLTTTPFVIGKKIIPPFVPMLLKSPFEYSAGK